MKKNREWRDQRAYARKTRQNEKRARQRRNAARRKHSAMKAAFKAFVMSDTQSVAKTRKSPDSTVYMPFLTALMKPRKPEIAVPDAKPFKPFQSNRRAA